MLFQGVNKNNKKLRRVNQNFCYLCNSNGKDIYTNISDNIFGFSTGWSIKCCVNSDCNLLWLSPSIHEDDIHLAYENYYTSKKQDDLNSGIAFLQKCYYSIKFNYNFGLNSFVKYLGYLVYLNPVRRTLYDFSIMYLPNQKSKCILDFGCGNGWLLENLQNLGWDTHGVDFDENALNYCKSNGHKVFSVNNFLNEPEEPKYDVIILNHVIEHLYDPRLVLKKLNKRLKAGGRLIVATPNTDNWQRAVFGKFWFQLDPPRHIMLFNSKNLEELLISTGYIIEKSITTTRMDAWSTIVSIEVKRKGRFQIGVDKKSYYSLLLGIIHQLISQFLLLFKKYSGGEVIVFCNKSNE
ncbi:MAG: class I SAM-dependent methyltransferase [Flavobacterium sp.]|jgi:2-polyprenyl-3-methyl-5-hydroxy-6-metoxy-1,4-benzoquinol methylase|nr:class I SAM-dependent methyltransferase [Flavobacterium sp.]